MLEKSIVKDSLPKRKTNVAFMYFASLIIKLIMKDEQIEKRIKNYGRITVNYFVID